MFFDIFYKWFEAKMTRRRVKMAMKIMGEMFNQDLISKLEENDQGEIYLAHYAVLTDLISRVMPQEAERAKDAAQRASTGWIIKDIKNMAKCDPQSAFLFLVQIHAHLLTEEEFRNFFRELSELPDDIMDMIVFKNSNLSLQFKAAGR
ncbi:MAG: hypothetical protein Q7R46_00480 [bacterium]|nr:hypothetical protein [bacterium]